MESTSVIDWLEGLDEASNAHEEWRNTQGYNEDEVLVADAVYCADLGGSGFPLSAARAWGAAAARIGVERTSEIRAAVFEWYKGFLAGKGVEWCEAMLYKEEE